MKTNTTVISALGIISEFSIVKLIFFFWFVLFFKFANQCPSLQMCPYSKTGTQAVKKRPGELLFSVWGGGGPLPTSAVQTGGGAADLIAMRACTHFEQHHKPMGIKSRRVFMSHSKTPVAAKSVSHRAQ